MATDDIGYKRPPKHSQFQKGASGNPRGRPKKTPTFQSDLAAELREKLTITENGRARRITKQRALIKTLAAAAIKSDIRAVNALLACMRLFGVEPEEPQEVADIADLEIVDRYLRKTRGKTTSEKEGGQQKRKHEKGQE